jgi:hypothetical protein
MADLSPEASNIYIEFLFLPLQKLDGEIYGDVKAMMEVDLNHRSK